MVSCLAQRSTCARRKVGCMLVDKQGKILSMGYNGVPSGHVHCIDVPCYKIKPKSGTELDKCKAIHAEANALMRCEDVRLIHTAYCTTMPCFECQKLLLNTACERIVYRDTYKQDTPIVWDGELLNVM